MGKSSLQLSETMQGAVESAANGFNGGSKPEMELEEMV